MKAFEQIVADAYENGDFELPTVNHTGDIHPEDLDHTGVTIVHRMVGEAVIRECLSSELELITVESPYAGEIRHTLLKDGRGHIIDEDTPHISRAWGADGIVYEMIVTNEPVDLNKLLKPDEPQ